MAFSPLGGVTAISLLRCSLFALRDPGARSLALIKAASRGVVVYLRDGHGGLEIPNTTQASDTTSDQQRTAHWREIGIGAQIPHDLGVSSIRLLTAHHFDYVGLSCFDIRITETDIIDS